MAVNDAADTRIKAADAASICNFPHMLSTLGRSRRFRALASMRFDPILEQPVVQAWASDEASADVIRSYCRGLSRRAPDEVMEARGLVLLGVHQDGVAEMASWGVNGASCGVLGRWAKASLESIPACPFQTWFGWGNGGVPKRLTPDEYDSLLSERQKAYVDYYTAWDAV